MASVSSTDDSTDSISIDSISSTDLTPISRAPVEYEEILQNIYVSRRKRAVKEDDIYECNCNPSRNECCDVGCLNRMYSAECNPDYCPLGTQCHNRRFQNREWCDVEIRPAGKKGWGLFANQRIKKDTFVIEYIGEIIDSVEVKTRLRWKYFGSKKFFILSLGAGYLIDATVKGSKARFMNHSCSPNCYTQKWTVLGERCIGFFALCDIDMDEELTFDYQFQRYGEEKHPCYCGSNVCRKWLGATKPTAATTHSTHHTAIHHSSSNDAMHRIIYRTLNPTIQMKRHSMYHTRLMDMRLSDIKANTMFKQLTLKGSICKAMANAHDNTHNIVHNNHNTVQFDHICYRMLHVKKDINIDTLKSITQSMHTTDSMHSNPLLHQLYGDCIDDDEEEVTVTQLQRIPKRRYNVYQKPIKRTIKKEIEPMKETAPIKETRTPPQVIIEDSVFASPLSLTTPITPCSDASSNSFKFDTQATKDTPSNSDSNQNETRRSNSNSRKRRKRRRSVSHDSTDHAHHPCKRQRTNNAFASDSNGEEEYQVRNGYVHRNHSYNRPNRNRNPNYNPHWKQTEGRNGYNHNYNQSPNLHARKYNHYNNHNNARGRCNHSRDAYNNNNNHPRNRNRNNNHRNQQLMVYGHPNQFPQRNGRVNHMNPQRNNRRMNYMNPQRNDRMNHYHRNNNENNNNNHYNYNHKQSPPHVINHRMQRQFGTNGEFHRNHNRVYNNNQNYNYNYNKPNAMNRRFCNRNGAHRNHWNGRSNRGSFNQTPQRRKDWRVRPQQRERERMKRQCYEWQNQNQKQNQNLNHNHNHNQNQYPYSHPHHPPYTRQ